MHDYTSVDLVLRDFKARDRLGYPSASIVLLSPPSSTAAWKMVARETSFTSWLSPDVLVVSLLLGGCLTHDPATLNCCI